MFFKHIVLLLLALTLVDAQAYVSQTLIKNVEKKYNRFAENRFIDMQEKLDELKNKSTIIKLNSINTFFNQVKYKSDQKNYNMSDYWATPWEFLARDAGDCEDYVIAKYFALRYLGIDAKKMYFTYVKSTQFKEAHMVLTYFETPSSEPLILDSNNRFVLPASKRTDLIPIYNFNGDILSNSAKKEHQKTTKKWDDLIQNTKKGKI
ncbi:transglutaminase-like cysteine peptidase [bacterium]|nr:transglutaminase-like cysteine peptidase [bacterium]MBU1884555.1 transglutaminase-like cysteine peptidase [bacterium]